MLEVGAPRTLSFVVESELRPRDFIPLVIDVVKLENMAMRLYSCQQRWGSAFSVCSDSPLLSKTTTTVPHQPICTH